MNSSDFVSDGPVHYTRRQGPNERMMLPGAGGYTGLIAAFMDHIDDLHTVSRSAKAAVS